MKETTYVIQGIMSDIVCVEFLVEGDESRAISSAQRIHNSPTFEGDIVRVLTIDSELVWHSGESSTGEEKAQ